MLRYLNFVKDFENKSKYFERNKIRSRTRYNEMMALKDELLGYYELQEYLIAFPESPIKNYDDFKENVSNIIKEKTEKIKDYYSYFM